MASQPPKSGITVVFARAVAKPGKGDELEKLLQHAVASANSDKEPYTLDYRCARHGDVSLSASRRLSDRLRRVTWGLTVCGSWSSCCV